MKQEYVNAFLAPARLVWKKELSADLELVGATAVSHQFTTEDVTAIIGVSGSLHGNVLYGFSGRTPLLVASTMLGQSVQTMDHIALSALGEIANMITGNAATQLAAVGYPCDISPPVLIEPVGSKFTTLGGAQILVSFSSTVGDLGIRISLSEGMSREG